MKPQTLPEQCSLGVCVQPPGVPHPGRHSLPPESSWCPWGGSLPSGLCFSLSGKEQVLPRPRGLRLVLAASLPGDGYYLAVGGAVAQHNWSHISTVLQDQKFRCQLIDSSEDLGLISIQGPAR